MVVIGPCVGLEALALTSTRGVGQAYCPESSYLVSYKESGYKSFVEELDGIIHFILRLVFKEPRCGEVLE